MGGDQLINKLLNGLLNGLLSKHTHKIALQHTHCRSILTVPLRASSFARVYNSSWKHHPSDYPYCQCQSPMAPKAKTKVKRRSSKAKAKPLSGKSIVRSGSRWPKTQLADAENVKAQLADAEARAFSAEARATAAEARANAAEGRATVAEKRAVTATTAPTASQLLNAIEWMGRDHAKIVVENLKKLHKL